MKHGKYFQMSLRKENLIINFLLIQDLLEVLIILRHKVSNINSDNSYQYSQRSETYSRGYGASNSNQNYYYNNSNRNANFDPNMYSQYTSKMNMDLSNDPKLKEFLRRAFEEGRFYYSAKKSEGFNREYAKNAQHFKGKESFFYEGNESLDSQEYYRRYRAKMAEEVKREEDFEKKMREDQVRIFN